MQFTVVRSQSKLQSRQLVRKMRGGVKQIQLPHANGWLTMVKSQSPALYDRVAKLLEAWERDEQDKSCYQKFMEVLKNEPALLEALNIYVEEDVHFKVVKPQQQQTAIEEYMQDLKLNNKKTFLKAYNKLNQLHNEGVNDDNKIIEELIQTFRDEPEVHRRLLEICMSNKERESTAPAKKPKARQPQVSAIETYVEKRRNRYEDQDERNREPKEPPKTAVEEMFRFKKNESSMGPRKYESLVKLLYLHEIGIITRHEYVAMVTEKAFENAEAFEQFREIIDTRDHDRRKNSNIFKPLTELNFCDSERTTHSYVKLPWLYPTACQGKTANPELDNILNDKWVIVPVGSEHSTFSIRPKSQYEEPLLKSEDERYEMDLCLFRYRKCAKLLRKAVETTNQEQAEKIITQVISTGVIQNVYRNASKEQKEQIEVFLKIHRSQFALVLADRLETQARQMENIRNGPALKIWHDVADRNFLKSLDRRSFYYKHSERDAAKLQTFIDQYEKMTELPKTLPIPSIINTFDNLSKTEYVHHVREPTLVFQQNNPFNPKYMLYFQNAYIMGTFRNMIKDYVDAQPSSTDKAGLKRLFDEFIFPFIGSMAVVQPETFEGFDHDQKLEELTSKGMLPIKKQKAELDDGTKNQTEKKEEYILIPPIEIEPDAVPVKEPEKVPTKKIRVIQKQTNVDYLPVATPNIRVLYGSGQLYCLLRMFYIIYERVMRAYELCHTFTDTILASTPEEQARKVAKQRFTMFLYVFNSNLRSKQATKIEDNLKEVFGMNNYLFAHLLKFFQFLLKAAQSCLVDCFTGELLRIHRQPQQCQQIYLRQVQQISLGYNNSNKIIRVCSLKGLLTINWLESIYKPWFIQKKDKEMPAFDRILDRTQTYLYNKKSLLMTSPEELKKKGEIVIVRNGHEYYNVPRTLQLLTKGEDFLFRKRKQQLPLRKTLLKQLKRSAKLREFMDDQQAELQA